MYYYIFESAKNSSEQKNQEKIKQILIMLGISGETVLVSPARTATELTIMGLEKGYSTIVAVGSEELVNEIGSTIAQSDAVLGIIPTNYSEELKSIIGTDDIKLACEALQKRHLVTINMGYLDPGINFLTSLSIQSPKPLTMQAEIDDFYISTKINRININNNLITKIFSNKKQEGFLNNIFNIFNEPKKNNCDSIFYANKIRLRTSEITPVKIGNLVVAKTPIIVYRKPEALKIIKFRSKIK